MPGPTGALLAALANAGCEAPVDLPQQIPELGDHAAAMLSQPSRYPSSWLAAAERWLSDHHPEQPLAIAAAAHQWVPKIPRL